MAKPRARKKHVRGIVSANAAHSGGTSMITIIFFDALAGFTNSNPQRTPPIKLNIMAEYCTQKFNVKCSSSYGKEILVIDKKAPARNGINPK